MSTGPRAFTGSWGGALAGALSAWTAVTAAGAWSVLTLQDASWLWRAALLALLVAATGWATRITLGERLTRTGTVLATVAAQSVVGLIVWWWLVAGTALPWSAAPSSVVHRIREAIHTSLHDKPPVPSADVLPVLLAGVLAAVVVMELVAVGVRRPAIGGLVVVGIWVATFFDDPVDPSAWMIGLPALGWCALLVLVTNAGDGVRGETWAGDARRRAWFGAAGLGLAAILTSVVITAIVPVDQLRVIDLTGGSGSGGNGLRVTNPMVDMRKQLTQTTDQNLLTVQTDDPDPSYLRLTVLTTFQDLQWTPGSRTVPATNTAAGTLPPLTGVSQQIPRTSFNYVVTGLPAFRAKWLPTAAPITAIKANDGWRYDSSTMDFLASDNDLTTAGQRWQMQGAQLDLRETDLQSLSPSAVVGVRYLELPKSFPTSVRKLARDLTSSATSPFAKAVALQRWFRSDGGFTYDTSVSLGDGTNALEEFLAVGNRRGFCQQFASAMAAMARALNIPARVSVGFLKPSRVSNTNTWIYSSHDLHAWPELYFQGAGWVRFEPTPGTRAATVPDYTQNLPEVAPADPTDAPSASTSAQPQGPSARPTNDNGQTGSTDDGTGHPGLWLGGAAVLAVLVLLVLAPWGLRIRRRRRRLHEADPEALWAELRDTAIDLDVAWPDHASVRRQADSLPRVVSGDAGIDESLTRLRAAVEVERYARVGAGTTVYERSTAREDLSAVTAALWENAGPKTRRRARLWPPSLRLRR